MQIVLADASRIALRTLTTMLEARGHVVLATTDGAEALKLISDNVEIDALITSIELTSLTGFELSWEVRLLSVARHRPLYIIVMSSSSDEKTISEALDSGADDFIRKPPSATALYARLRAAERLIGSETELIRLADRDPLTELLNRRAFFTACERAIERAQVGRLSAIMVDIDHFKQVNDRYGHDVGDHVIRAVAHEAAHVSKLVGRLVGRRGVCDTALGRVGGSRFRACRRSSRQMHTDKIRVWNAIACHQLQLGHRAMDARHEYR